MIRAVPHGLLRRLAAVAHAAKQLRIKLGDDTDHPAYTFIEPRVGYRMEKGEKRERGTS